MRCTPTVLVIKIPIRIAHRTYSMSGTVQCSRFASAFHQSWAYLPSSPIAMSRSTPGTYASTFLVGNVCSERSSSNSTVVALIASPRNLRQQARDGEQGDCACDDRGPPVEADTASRSATFGTRFGPGLGHDALLLTDD